jgi:glyoxylase-like metal-dependent hydrolase (beta-lactamase superfamily II)
MRVHHLNCGTWCPPASRLINGTDGLHSHGRIVCHCLLIESDEGLVLVDTGLGVADLENPRDRIGAGWTSLMRPEPDPEQSALRQIEELGFYHDDVRHIVVTHLDFDHAGGIPDFPEAKVHVFEPEYEAAMHPGSIRERFRYKSAHWEHEPEWVRYELEGDRWFGFESVRTMGDLNLDILLIPLPGHTRGHCGVAVRTAEGWLLNAGDAYFHHNELWGTQMKAPLGMRLYQGAMHMNHRKRQANLQRLRELAENHVDEVKVFCSHDPVEFEQFLHPAPSYPPIGPEARFRRWSR